MQADVVAAPRERDDALLAEMTAPPDLEQARASYLFWSRRLSRLPWYKRSERREAEQMMGAWRQRLEAVEAERYAPGIIGALLESLGVRWRPNPRRVVAWLVAALIVVALLVVALAVAVVVLWPELEPVVRPLLEGPAGEDSGD